MEPNDSDKGFEDIIAEYGGIINKICYYFASDPNEFKDLRQEVFYHIWKGLDKFRQDSKLSTWIYRISFNTCITFHRKEKKFEKISVDHIMEMPDEYGGSSKLEEYMALQKLIRKLKYEDRALILMWLDEMSYDEISNLTGLNRNTVAIRLKRIKEKLIKMVN